MTEDDLYKNIRSGTEWARSGPSPLKAQLAQVVEGLEAIKVQMERERAQKVKILEALMQSSVTSESKYRVKK